MPVMYSIFVTLDTKIWDDAGADAHTLISGITIIPGVVRVTTVKTDLDVPLSATFISEDESSTLPGSVETLPAGPDIDGNYVWGFRWDSLPEIGPRAVLRFEEVMLNGTGAISNFTVNVVSDVDDPDLEPPIGPGFVRP